MAVLGFCAGNTPLVIEMAYESLNIDKFDIVKNIEIDIPESFLSWKDLTIQVFESSQYQFDDPGFEIHFGVLDPHIKYVLYHYFSKIYGVEKNKYTNIIHPASYFAGSSVHDNGFMLDPMSMVSTKCKIGFGVTVKRSSSVGHHANIGDFVSVNPGAVISGNVSIGEGTAIGSGATIIHNINIGKRSIVGAGSVVTKDIPDGVVAYGNPCKVVRKYERWDKAFETLNKFTDKDFE